MLTKVLILALAVGVANAACSNQCSGHGQCGANDKCSCYANFQGPDCSERVCPFSTAFSTAAGNHDDAECSNRGSCDRGSGMCECYDGYGGKACQYMLCPEDCSGHGTCETLNRLDSNYDLTNWDAKKIMHCKCDPGYQGNDCSERMCPPGDDPLTTMRADVPTSPQTYEVQEVILDGSGSAYPGGEFVLGYTDWRGETWKTWAIDAGATAIQVEEALEALPNHAVPNVTVTVSTDGTDFHRKFQVTFVHPRNSGDQHELELLATACADNGCQPRTSGLSAFTAKATSASGVVSGTRVSETTKGTTENVACSGRGNCNTDDGTCECHEGYKGIACETQTIIL